MTRRGRTSLLTLSVTLALAGCGLLGPAPMTLDEAAAQAGVTGTVLRLDDHTAAAVRLSDGRLQLLFFIRDEDGWVQSGHAGPGQEIAGARLGLVGGGHEETHRTILFGAGPPGVASVSTNGPFVFGISDPVAETWLLAAPIEHGATMRWTIRDSNDGLLLSGQGLAPISRGDHLVLPGMTAPEAAEHLSSHMLACEARPANDPRLLETHCEAEGTGIGFDSRLRATLQSADGTGLDRVIAVWELENGRLDEDAAIGYLANTVGAIVFGDPPPPRFVTWVTRHIGSGGTVEMDRMRVVLETAPRQRTITFELADQR